MLCRPGFILAAFPIDKIGRKLLQSIGFAVMAAAFACMWLVPGATTTLLPFLARSPCQSRKAAAPGYIAREKPVG